jgi:hypothetical protein
VSAGLNDDLPDLLRSVTTRPLFVMRLHVPRVLDIGASPGTHRRVGVVDGGEFEGERLSGEVLDGGADWQAVRADGTTELDVRLVLKTGDGALIAMRYRGLRHGPADVLVRIGQGEVVDPSTYYFRISGTFETTAVKYDWLNGIIAVGIGHRLATGPIYSLFELL